VTVDKEECFTQQDRVDLAGLQTKVAGLRLENFPTQQRRRILASSSADRARPKYKNIVGVMDALNRQTLPKVNLAHEPLNGTPARKE